MFYLRTFIDRGRLNMHCWILWKWWNGFNLEKFCSQRIKNNRRHRRSPCIDLSLRQLFDLCKFDLGKVDYMYLYPLVEVNLDISGLNKMLRKEWICSASIINTYIFEMYKIIKESRKFKAMVKLTFCFRCKSKAIPLSSTKFEGITFHIVSFCYLLEKDDHIWYQGKLMSQHHSLKQEVIAWSSIKAK